MTNKKHPMEELKNLTADEQNDFLNAIFGRNALEAYFKSNHMPVPDKLCFTEHKNK